VTVNGEVVGQIGPGFAIFVGVGHGDGEEQARWLATKVAGCGSSKTTKGSSIAPSLMWAAQRL
jgi:D-Tyr-tRNAtyr deacylase